MVLNDVPAHTTVVGVPAKPVCHTKEDQPALEMNHRIDEDNFVAGDGI